MVVAESETVDVVEYIAHMWWMQGVDEADKQKAEESGKHGLRPAKEGLVYPKIFLQPSRFHVATLSIVDKKEAHILAIQLPVCAVEFIDAPSSKLLPLECTGILM